MQKNKNKKQAYIKYLPINCTGDRDQDHPHGKEMQKSEMAVWGGLTNSCEKKRSEKQRRKGKIEAFFKTTEWERLGISSRKSETPKEHFRLR